jgi:hypothetical protein
MQHVKDSLTHGETALNLVTATRRALYLDDISIMGEIQRRIEDRLRLIPIPQSEAGFVIDIDLDWKPFEFWSLSSAIVFPK